MLVVNDIFELLEGMWKPRIRRSTKLIVSSVTYSGSEGSLNNAAWCYNVPYAFRAALDLHYDERIKDKKKYRVWTQGPFISFSEGDMFESNQGLESIQVQDARPMRWDEKANAMDQGFVTYAFFNEVEFGRVDTPVKTVTQMEFLRLLV